MRNYHFQYILIAVLLLNDVTVHGQSSFTIDNSIECPAKEPVPGGTCNLQSATTRCKWGQECCLKPVTADCSKTAESCHHSKECFCSNGVWMCLMTDFCMMNCGLIPIPSLTKEAPINSEQCPTNQPDPSSTCNLADSTTVCKWGKECCSKPIPGNSNCQMSDQVCSHSFECTCMQGQWLCLNTDFCMVPPCTPTIQGNDSNLPGFHEFCGSPNDACMNSENWVQCMLFIDTGCKRIKKTKSCPAQFVCGDTAEEDAQKNEKCYHRCRCYNFGRYYKYSRCYKYNRCYY